MAVSTLLLAGCTTRAPISPNLANYVGESVPYRVAHAYGPALLAEVAILTCASVVVTLARMHRTGGTRRTRLVALSIVLAAILLLLAGAELVLLVTDPLLDPF